MRLLHTSDWHLGRALYGRKRYEEFEAFLGWLADIIATERVDLLLVAGDIFDTSTPSNRAQALYYRFLCRVAASCCRHVVVIAGNHDSPSFLDAPRELLKAMNVHVVGAAAIDQPEDELLLLTDTQGNAELIVCAVPYLRDREIRLAQAGESLEQKEQRLIEGIRDHYARLAALAEMKRRELPVPVPIIAMGHLFTAGGETLEGDGVRELYIGSLAHVSPGIFPDCFDYLALGHLHVPQRVGGSEVRRYSGSPLPMGFGEAGQEKSVCLVDLAVGSVSVELRRLPCFQRLERVQGDWEAISSRVQALSDEHSSLWLEIVYEGEAVMDDLRARLDSAIAGSQIEILRIRNNRIIRRVLSRMRQEETLDDLTAEEVFERCLSQHRIPEEQRPDLFNAYREVLRSLDEEDRQAE